MSDAGCHILHVDMDAFYASVAIRERPDLQDKPVIIGGWQRGVVLSANYHARAFGIRSGMPGTRARRLCPQAVVVQADFTELGRVSKAVMENFREVTPLVRVVSLDEAFLDVSGSTRRLGSAAMIAEQLRARIYDEQGITCSAGIAPSISVAKIASRHAKPDGVVVVPPDRVVSFLHPLDLGELWGVGEKTRAKLRRIGLLTVADVAHTPLAALQHTVGPAAGHKLHQLAWGADRRLIEPRYSMEEPDKSMGAESTFARDLTDRELILREVLRLAAKVSRRLRAASFAGRTVALKVRFSDFTTITRSRTMVEATDVTQEIYGTASGLYDALRLDRVSLRLVGVRVEGLVPRQTVHHQFVLGERSPGWREADRAVDLAAQRFGSSAVRPATLLG